MFFFGACISILIALWVYLGYLAQKNRISFPWELGLVILGILIPKYNLNAQIGDIILSFESLFVLMTVAFFLNIINIRQQFLVNGAKELFRYTIIGIFSGLLIGLSLFLTGKTDYLYVNASLPIISLIVISVEKSMAEEMLFRGFLLGSFKRFKFHGVFANVLQSLLFTLLHIPRYQGDWIVLSIIFLGSLFSGYLTWKNNNLISALVMHSVINLTAVGWRIIAM